MAQMWIWRIGIFLILLAATTTARGQNLPVYQPVFADEPKAAVGPEFCPPGAAQPVITRTPFEETVPRYNAWVDTCPEDMSIPCIFYGGVGPIALSRERLGNGFIALADPVNNTPGFPFNADTGIFSPATGPTAVRFGDVPADYHWGVQGTLGVQKGQHALEFSGFYISEQSDHSTVILPSQLNLPFGNFPAPQGFEGNNSLWLQADQVSVELQSRLANAELNYRHIFIPEFELIFGVRYVDLQETFRISTNDDGVVAPGNSLAVATYEADAKNRLLGGQVGFECQQFVAQKLALGFSNKNMIGANFLEVNNRLFRGDGFERTPGNRSETITSGLVELNAFATIWFNQNCRLRAGYQIFWLLNVAEAHQQVNFDPNVPQGTVSNNDSLFYHGPRLEFQVGF